MKPHGWLVLVILGALVGLTFAGLSTYDFVQHLDRQVHNIHCSFVPGLGRDTLGTSGCQVAMLSPYSSVFRSAIWGGIPIALPAMCVFAFLLYYALDVLLTRRQTDPRATGFLALATGLPALASVVMAYLSLTRLGTTCKLCVAIYIASAACLIGAMGLCVRAARISARAFVPQPPAPGPVAGQGNWSMAAHGRPAIPQAGAAGRPMTSYASLAAALGIGVLFVLVPVVLYAAAAPDHSRFVGSCESLGHVDDPYGVMVPIGGAVPGAAPSVEVLDPLCPACRAFEQRLEASGLAPRVQRRLVLFPLDSACNWMVTEAVHPGACVVSEAVLCAGERAEQVLAWAFEMQEQIRKSAAEGPGAAGRMVRARFPELASCVGSPAVRSRLNKSLRWIVQNNLPVVTPQFFVAGVKLCDEDVDLGLEYALGKMLDRHARGQLAPARTAPAPADPGGTR